MPFLSTLGSKLAEKSVGVVGINSNDVSSYPEDGPENMAQVVRRHKIKFPYVFDETQAVAKSYRAACTPDFFLFDKDGLLAYRYVCAFQSNILFCSGRSKERLGAAASALRLNYYPPER